MRASNSRNWVEQLSNPSKAYEMPRRAAVSEPSMRGTCTWPSSWQERNETAEAVTNPLGKSDSRPTHFDSLFASFRTFLILQTRQFPIFQPFESISFSSFRDVRDRDCVEVISLTNLRSRGSRCQLSGATAWRRPRLFRRRPISSSLRWP
jgi:hypothetical protein